MTESGVKVNKALRGSERKLRVQLVAAIFLSFKRRPLLPFKLRAIGLLLIDKMADCEVDPIRISLGVRILNMN